MTHWNRIAAVSLAVLTLALVSLRSQPPKPATPAATPPSSPPTSPDAARQQEENLKLFNDFKSALLRLALRYEASDKPEDKARAKTVRSALELAEKEGVNAQFGELVKTWRSNPSQVQQIDDIIGKDAQLQKALAEILNILQTDDETARLKAEIARLSAFMKELKELKRRQELVRAKTDAQRGDAKPIAESQSDLAKQTKEVADRMSGEKKGGPDSSKDEIAKAEPKGDAKPGDNPSQDKPDAGEEKASPKDGDGKEGDPRGSESKPGKPSESPSKPGGEPKPGSESKPGGEAKPGEYAQGKQGGDGSSSKGKGSGKGSDKASAPQNGGEGKGIGGTPSTDSPPGDSKSGGSPSGGGQGGDSPPSPQQPQTPGRKSVQEAYPHQNEATEELNKNQRPKASKQQDNAIEKLAKAIEELQKKIDQLREEENLKLLANLEARCSQMLRIQTEVYENTKLIHATIVKNANQKTNAEHQRSQQQAERERQIVDEANKALKLLEAEGSAVAFSRVLEEVREDMTAIQRRLDATIVDPDTQTIEENVISMLKEMIAALKKAQQDIQDKQKDPGNPSNNKQNQKLINLLQELKLIRSMQDQVNKRTKMYAGKFTGEQAIDAIHQDELKQLAARQAKVQDMLQKIASGQGEQ